MDAAMAFPGVTDFRDRGASRVVSAAEFRNLLVSHRRLVRIDRRAERLRGLQDTDTGETFYTDEHRLLEAPRR